MNSGQDEFIARYHQMVDELDRSARNDPETMWLLGSLVARLLAEATAQSWTQLKIGIDNTALKQMVVTLNASAATYEAERKGKPAYVARLLGASLVASRITDARTHQRDQLLNHFIDTAVYVYTSNHHAKAASKG